MNPTELHIGQAYFWVCAAIAVAGAVFTVTAKNPIRGAMGLLLMILAVAGLYIALHAQFLAAIQLLVYAGAIVILFVFVIMLLGPDATSPRDKRGQVMRILGGGLFGAAGLFSMSLLVRAGSAASAATEAKDGLLENVPSDFGSVDAIGKILFTNALIPFELSSALLMVAILGAVAVARGHQRKDSASKVSTAPPTAESTGAPELARLSETEEVA